MTLEQSAGATTTERLLADVLDDTFAAFERVTADRRATLFSQEIGHVTAVGHGTAHVVGLPGVQAEEVLTLTDGLHAMAFDLDPRGVGVILLGESTTLRAGSVAYRTGTVIDVPVGPALLGRVVDALGQPLDDLGPLSTRQRLPIERPALPILHRASVTEPLQTGIKVIDALVPIGRGQRELILGDRQTGKSAIALSAVLNQRHSDVLCVYCLIGQRNATVVRLLHELQRQGAMAYTTVVVARGEDAPGLQFIAPYSATTIAEHFREQGRDVLIVYDDLTQHARAYRELSLLLQRPPGREAYPGDIFYIHARLLERAACVRPAHGGGSLTALPIVETQAQNLASYIPTNLISITDGQIYLSPTLFQKGLLPAVDVGISISRVGGQAQLPAYRSIAGPLRLAYAQFEELEIFARFSTRLEDETRRAIQRGQRVRAVLKQPQTELFSIPEQIAVLLAVTHGIVDELPLERIPAIEQALRQAVRTQLPDLCQRIEAGQPLRDADREQLLRMAKRVIGTVPGGAHDADD